MVMLGGNLGTVNVATSGITNVYLNGVNQGVMLDLSGITNVFVTSTNPSTHISGRYAAAVATCCGSQPLAYALLAYRH